MELEVFWSEFAEMKLVEIYSYYKQKAGIKVAKKIITEIVNSTINLNLNPKIGQVEDYLKERKQEFRYLVFTNFKVIYYINFETKKIVIANVFDTRQNPEKLNETK